MAKKNTKPRKDSGKPGSKARKITDKAKKSKKKTEKVYLPVAIAQPEQEEPMSEHEISYMDKLLSVEMEKLAAKGLNNNEIIKALGISRDTFYRKLRDEPYFSYSLYKHRGIAQKEIESALVQRAKGYKYLEKTTEAKPIKKMVDGQIVTTYELMTAKVVEKEVAPDVAAQEFWLTNNAPSEWKKKPEPMTINGRDMSARVFSIKRRE